mgnify:CR=1 FL=1
MTTTVFLILLSGFSVISSLVTMVLMGLAVKLVSMAEFDKVKQMILQLASQKNKGRWL